jgi:hypothetical protein
MDSERNRWWIVDEIARWWRQASLEQRGVLMQRAVDGTKEASLSEVQQGALLAEFDEEQNAKIAALFIEARTARQRIGRG